MSISLLVFLLASGPTTTPAAAPRLPEWVLGTDAAGPGDTIDAWLLVPAPNAWPGGAATVDVSTPGGASVWLKLPKDECDSGNQPKTTRCQGALAGGDIVLRICVQLTRAQPTRLVAGVMLEPAGGTPSTRIVASGPVTVKDEARWYELGATGQSLLAAAVAFIAGVATYFIQGWRDNRKDARLTKRAFERTLVEALLPEFNENRALLTQFVASPAGTAPPVLIAGAYNDLANKAGVLGFLGEPERATYLQSLHDLYAAFGRYDALRINDPNGAPIRAAARDILQKIGKLKP